MKKTFLLVQALLLCILVSCTDQDDKGIASAGIATAQQFAQIKHNALQEQKQVFSFNASDGYTSFTSDKGVNVYFNTACLTKNGQQVTGDFTVEFVEIFDRGNMLATNKTTMGNLNGTQRLLISGGEFYIQPMQNGTALQTTCQIYIAVPSALTGGIDNDMAPFMGSVDASGNIIWNPAPLEFWNGSTEQYPNGPVFYNCVLESFGWFNCDKFASFTGPMTDIEAMVPAGYNAANSGIYVAIQGEPNTLGDLSGNYPIGLQCYIIFVTADTNGNIKYAIKSVTLTADASYTFTEDELQTVTQAQLIAAINALP